MKLFKWATKYGVPPQAILELREIFNLNHICEADDRQSETEISADVQYEATQKGLRLWRNNVGGAYDKTGRFIRYGLCNESPAMNKELKSSDLIGIRPVTITSSMVGQIIGQFVAREIKESDWTYTGTEREQAQLRYLELVLAFGGDAAFANDVGTL